MFSSAISRFIKQYNYPAFKPKAVFFDMDGVLFDSMPGHASAWVKAMNEFGFPFSEMQAYMYEGQTGSATINEVYLNTLGREAAEEEKKSLYKLKSEYFDQYGKARPMPYALDLLQQIKSEGMQAVVVTGSGQPSLLSNIENNFPGIFDHDKMVTAYDVKYGKPHPEPYLMALKKSGVNPWEVIAIDNAPLGVKSASSAELFTIGLNTGPLEPEILTEYGADVVLGDMKELACKWSYFTQAGSN